MLNGSATPPEGPGVEAGATVGVGGGGPAVAVGSGVAVGVGVGVGASKVVSRDTNSLFTVGVGSGVGMSVGVGAFVGVAVGAGREIAPDPDCGSLTVGVGIGVAVGPAGSRVELGTSSSVIDTAAALLVPADTPLGKVPKPRSTDSPSSSLSTVAAKVMVCSVSVAPKVLPDTPGRTASYHPVAPPKPVAEQTERADNSGRIAWARTTWGMSEPIPRRPDHPVRRWLARRNLWHPEIPVPDGLRWLPAAAEKRRHSGAGSIVALAAEPLEWSLSWPQLPPTRGVQLIAVAPDGMAAELETRSGWLGKQSRGVLTDCVAVFGNPMWEEAIAPVRVAEGAADTLALASRYE